MNATPETLFAFQAILVGLLAFGVVDVLYVVYKLDGRYSFWESTNNFLTMLVTEGIRRSTFVWRFGLFAGLHALTPLRIPTTLAWTLVCYLLVDLVYYWKHRFLHENELGWAFHSTHHSSPELNLTTGMRSNWIQRFIEDAAFAPLTLLGFSPFLVMILADLNLFSQVWIHTRVRGRWKFPGYLLNTPAAHRVHHAASREISGSNYGSTFIIWDRLFGTYRAEPEGPEGAYGLEEGPLGNNPLTLQFDGLRRYARARWGGQTKPAPARR